MPQAGTMKESGLVARTLKRAMALIRDGASRVVFFILFKFIPLAGSVIAFMDYKLTRGIFGSAWVGLKHFQNFFAYQDLRRVFWNTTRHRDL